MRFRIEKSVADFDCWCNRTLICWANINGELRTVNDGTHPLLNSIWFYHGYTIPALEGRLQGLTTLMAFVLL